MRRSILLHLQHTTQIEKILTRKKLHCGVDKIGAKRDRVRNEMKSVDISFFMCVLVLFVCVV